ncbi:geranylgeranyl transferase type-1 subunit beta [Oleoguttula sp. CCFEE 5521]
MESGVDAEDVPSFDKPRHIKYWTRCLKTLLPSMYTSNDSNRMYLAYFILSACDILGVLFTLTTAGEREGYLTWIYHCQHPSGGFRMWPGTDFGESSSAANAKWDPANGPATYFALASLMILRDDLQRVKRQETLEWIHRLQHADGSFGETIVDGKIEGGHDPRLAYCATGVRYILRHSEAGSAVVDGSTFSDIDVDALVGSIQRAESFDGGIADAPFHEPQAGYTFCSLGCMQFVERLRPDTAMSFNTPALQRAPSRPREVIRWLLNLQTTLTDPDDAPLNDLKSVPMDASSPTEIPASTTAQLQSHNLHQSPDKSNPWTNSSTTLSIPDSPPVHGPESIPAGFSGRPSKPPDTCYAFWALASLDLLQTSHLASRSQTRTYLLGLTQQAIMGGFTKFAHDRWADLYHSYLGLVALSLCSTEVERATDGIAEVDAGMCVSMQVRSKLDGGLRS